MGKKSQMKKFRRRRQRAGFALAASLLVVIFGVFMFSALDASSLRLASAGADTNASVQRVEPPNVDGGPEVAARDATTRNAGDRGGSASGGRSEEQKAQKEAADKNAGGGENGGDKNGGQDQKGPDQAAEPEIPTPATNDLWMDIPALGLNDNYIANSNSVAALDAGAAKLTESGFPWQDNANTYISGHRLGWPGTASWHQFYNLPNLAMGDRIYLYDNNGTVYTYEVSGFVEVSPSDTWVTGPKAGRDMISLMTCIENFGDYWTMGPNWYARYVVQADRVSVDPA